MYENDVTKCKSLSPNLYNGTIPSVNHRECVASIQYGIRKFQAYSYEYNVCLINYDESTWYLHT